MVLRAPEKRYIHIINLIINLIVQKQPNRTKFTYQNIETKML